MDKLTIVYKGAHSNTLYSAYFDGTTWHANTKIKDQPGGINPQTNYNPSLAMLNTRLYLIYKDAASTDICCAWYDGRTWTGGVKIKTMPGGISPKSNYTPNIAVLNGTLYMTYLDPSSYDVYTAWYDGSMWFGNKKIEDQNGGITPQSTINPAIAAYKNKIYIFYTGTWISNIYSATFDGMTWRGNTKISDQPGGISPKTASPPAVAIYNDCLYLSYTGHISSSLYTLWFDGTTWHGDTAISDQPGGISPASSDNPAMTAFYKTTPTAGEQLYLVYRGAHFTDLYTCNNYLGEWYGNTTISNQPGGISPASNYRPAVCVMASSPGTQDSWMSTISDATPLSDINIPGSHDAAAINSSVSTPYACHNNTITQQLEFGIRLLDVRLQVVKNNDGSFTFTTCHGDIGSKYGINTYQSFPSLMDECKTFLTTNDKEAVIMSLKIDDWSNVSGGDRNTALGKLSQLLAGYAVMTSSDMPTLGQARGKIVLYNRINQDLTLGVPIGWSDNTTGSYASTSSKRNFKVWVQDKYEGLNLSGSVKQKTGLVTDAFGHKSDGEVVWNFASAVWYGLFGVYIMPNFLVYFGQKTVADRPAKFGWTLFDFPFNPYDTDTYGPMDVVSLIIDSNFGYPTYSKKFDLYNHDEL